ncbi:MAG: glycosyltransferase family 2 protein [Reyranella sp.]|nr:glycosyltransferase family 2 protein [Alphaproteobacteria bacterium]MBR2815092.1 glycosyltransferase family 2 protein [Reyranella sp.]OJU40761.1 MAG: glycosyltransferase [Alphaproteobacteria bacterium 65-37]
MLSLVVPVFNEEEAVDLFLDTVVPQLERASLRFELVFVNDGSRDNTFARLFDRGCSDRRIRLVNLSRNFGKEAALTAGIDHARGDILIPMDIDLQDPPELIQAFVARWREGYDIVYGMRSGRHSDTRAKRLSADWFYRVFNSLSAVRIPPNVGDFRLVDRRAVEVLRQLPERNRFMKGLFAWVGFNSIGVPYERPSRAVGTTKFSLWRLWNFALDGVVSFSTAPLRAWFYVGVVIATIAVLYALFIVTRVLILGIDTPGYASLLIAVLLMGAIQLLSLGIIGEYLGRLFLEVKGRPIYVVEGIYEDGTAEPPKS